MIKSLLLLALTALCTACAHRAPSSETTSGASTTTPTPAQLRIATYNTWLYSDQAGGLVHELQGDSTHARKIAAVLQRVCARIWCCSTNSTSTRSSAPPICSSNVI